MTDVAPMTSPLAGLGALKSSTDDRDHPMPAGSSSIIRQHWHVPGGALDQFDTPYCVGFTAHTWLRAEPIVNNPWPLKPVHLYKAAQKEDPWPGEDYDGTTLRGVVKVLKKHGYITEYTWATEAEPVINYILTLGPVMLGCEWSLEMFKPNEAGFIYPTGEVIGRHAILLTGADQERRAVRAILSWGPNWGDNGYAWIRYDDLEVLVKHEGEAVTATERKSSYLNNLLTFVRL